MRILLVSDIHANWTALRSIDEEFDVCVCLGDLVEYGVRPRECLEWVRQRARYCVRGNHDHGTAQDVSVQALSGFKYLTLATRPLTRELLSADDRRFLAALPTFQAATLDGRRCFFVHASPRDPLDEYAAPTADFWAKKLDTLEAEIVCVGHTHQQYLLEVNGKLIINPGSVGVQRDGDPRLGYAVIDNGRVELKRREYPVEEAIADVEVSGLSADAKRLLSDVYRTGRIGKTTNGDGDAEAALS